MILKAFDAVISESEVWQRERNDNVEAVVEIQIDKYWGHKLAQGYDVFFPRLTRFTPRLLIWRSRRQM